LSTTIRFDRHVSRIVQFLTIARAGSIHAAARELNLTQPALTKSLRKLETQLGVNLFDRGASGAMLTKYGGVLLRYATAIEATMKHAEIALNEVQTGQIGSLRVVGGPVWLSLVLPGVAARLQRLPGKPLLSCVPLGPQAVEQLMNNEIDVLFWLPDGRLQADPSFRVKTKARYPMCLLVAKGHPLLRREGVDTLVEAARYPFALMSPSPITTGLLKRYLSDRGVAFPHVAMESGSLLSLLKLVRNTDFIGYVAAPLAVHADTSGLIPIVIRQPEFELHVSIMHRTSLAEVGIYRLFEQELDKILVEMKLA
jgi:DNA-binding transcriptional LysR family regulator